MVKEYEEGSPVEFTMKLLDCLVNLIQFMSLHDKEDPEYGKKVLAKYREIVQPAWRNLKDTDTMWIESFSAMRRYHEFGKYLDYAYDSLRAGKHDDAIKQFNIALSRLREFIEEQRM